MLHVKLENLGNSFYQDKFSIYLFDQLLFGPEDRSVIAAIYKSLTEDMNRKTVLGSSFYQVATLVGSAISGNHSQAMSGSSSTSAAKDYSQAVSFNDGRSEGGNSSQALSHNEGTSIAGEDGQAISLDRGKSIGRKYSQAICRHYGKADGGDCSQVIVGRVGSASGGFNSQVIACEESKVKGGIGSFLLITDGNGRHVYGIVGENGIKPDTWYVSKDGKLVEE